MIDILARRELADSAELAAGVCEEAQSSGAEAPEAACADAPPEHRASSSSAAAPAAAAEEEEDEDEEEDGQLTYDDLARRCLELAEISPGAPELKAGVEWCGRLLLRELRRATRKTEAQDDVRFADGAKLDDLLLCPEDLDGVARLSRHAVPKALRLEVHEAYREGRWVRRRQRRQEFRKALQMILLAKDALPWVLLSSLASAASASVGVVGLHYRAEVLAALQRPRRVAASAAAAAGASAGAAAPTAVRTAMMAMVLVELLAAAARALESQLRARSQDLMARSIQVRLFEALVAKDMTWWGGQKEPWANINKVICLPAQVESALAAPRTLVNRISTISIQFALVRQRSSRMLYAMLLMHWAKFGVNEVVSRLLSWFQRRSVRGLVMPSQDKFTWIYALSPEYIRLYQSFARGPNEALDLKRYLCGNNRQQELTGAVSSLAKPVMAVISQACTVVELNTMGSLMDEGTLDISQAETVMQYASGVARDSESTYWDITAFQDKLSPLARAWDFVALPPKIVLDRGFVPEGRAKGHFVFEGVHFHYPGRRSKILRGTSFEVKPGQVVGITGTTGCGKSTCLSLVERFFDVTKGRILLDGRDIREYQPRWLRSQIVAVSQEPKLLPLTIRDNLVFGCDHDPTLEEIEQACRAANIWDSLTDPQKFPNGLETQMTVAQNVAGGEKQRLCIARAILANPPILLLDEATSALDEVSQAQVQEALNKLMAGRTTLAASSAAARKS
ncbi:unnamed protein product [Prorocentrum cordatum]|uniref:ABC transporter domain-containing protein n=1 Tax=Prorocentrum cordatum TaxID=2364126 RepID=A0ABN9X8B0_9DINO|nr:unnamed protein product [Polarella glacialis]